MARGIAWSASVSASGSRTSLGQPPAIRAQGLAKHFHVGFRRRRVTALQDATFEVRRGCVFGLVGPNGAGKTTTIKILMGLLRPSAGHAEIGGKPVPSVASRATVGYLPEHPSFYDHLRADEFLIYVGHLFGMRRSESRRRADELLERVGLTAHVKKPIRKFSKGMIQRLGIAQTLIHDPEVVVLDEPQSGLDPIGRKEIKDLIVELGQRGRTVFFSSHILPDVEDVCDEIAVMIRGRVRDVGRVETLLSPRVVEVELEVSGLEEPLQAEIDGLALRVTPLEHTRLYAFEGGTDTSAILRQVVNAGGAVHRYVSHREDLEDLFVRETKAAEKEARA